MKSKINKFKHVGLVPLALLVGLMLPMIVSAQKTMLNPKLEVLARPRSDKHWISFRDNTNINPLTIFKDLKEGFELTADDDMKIQRTDKDEIGYNHFRYQQFYKNLKVVYGEYVVHQEGDGFVKSANGSLVNGLKLASSASISEKRALESALSFMHAKKYLWQNTEMERELKRQENNPNATYFPKGELVFAPGINKVTVNPAEFKLAWHFRIYTDDAKVVAKDVYVDANTGNINHYVDVAMNCASGTGQSAFNGSVSFNTELSGGTYRSHNDCQPTDIYVYNCNRGTAANTFYTDADNAWTATSQQSAVQAQWGALQVYNYYIGQHSRQSWDGATGDMIVYNNAVYGDPATANNACWGCYGNNTIFGAGNTTNANDDWNTNDIMGHEFTHGVTQASAGLVYSNESGALNESFSDIFGEMVESWSEGNCDYLVGGDRGAIRSFLDPNAYGDPDTYKGTYWYTGSGDNGGVHTNSSVQNRWFYLLSEGGTGTNDFGYSYNVTGITRFKARLIAYRALTMYLTSSSTYIDARKATLEAAWDLYGQCSQEIIAVGDAWHAVGVEGLSAAYAFNVCGTYSSGGFEQAISQLTAANGCTVTVNSPTDIVYFTARDRVILYPGFKATSGAKFIAYLEPCSSTRWKSAAPQDIMSDPEKGINKPVYTLKSPKLDEGIVTNGISVNPNPFVSNFDVSISSKQDEKVQINVYNSLGMKVQERQGVNVLKGTNKVTFNGANLAKGVYMVEIVMGDVKTIKKIVKM